MKKILIIMIMISIIAISCHIKKQPTIYNDPVNCFVFKDKIYNLWWALYMWNVVMPKIGTDGLELRYAGDIILFTYMRKLYDVSTLVKFLISKKDFIKLLEWLLIGRDVRIQPKQKLIEIKRESKIIGGK